MLKRIASRNLRWLLVSSVIGLFLGFYLASVRAFTSLQPTNLLIFLLLWAVPVILNSLQSDRF